MGAARVANVLAPFLLNRVARARMAGDWNMVSTVEFQIKDIVHPDPVQVLSALYEQCQVHGEIVAVTNGGDEPCYLVIKVSGLNEPVIVPKGKIASDSLT